MTAAPNFDYSADRAELAAELEATLAALPALRGICAAAKTAAEDARWRFQVFAQRVTAATRHGADDASPGLLQRLKDERQARDLANGAAERARRDVANLEWRAHCLRTDIQQLERLENPPPLVPRREIVARPKADLGTFDPIVMPAGATPADAA